MAKKNVDLFGKFAVPKEEETDDVNEEVEVEVEEEVAPSVTEEQPSQEESILKISPDFLNKLAGELAEASKSKIPADEKYKRMTFLVDKDLAERFNELTKERGQKVKYINLGIAFLIEHLENTLKETDKK